MGYGATCCRCGQVGRIGLLSGPYCWSCVEEMDRSIEADEKAHKGRERERDLYEGDQSAEKIWEQGGKI